jgi:propionyl-CoA synthetase
MAVEHLLSDIRQNIQWFWCQVAFIYDSPVTQTIKYTYSESKTEVAKLSRHAVTGVKKIDTAIIYMPMIPQTAFAMLACAE